MTSEIDFLHRGNLKSILELLLRAVIKATQPHFENRFFDQKRDHFAQAQLHLKCPIGRATSLQLPDLSLCGVSLAQFYLLSARLDQDDVAYAEAKLPQTILLLSLIHI